MTPFARRPPRPPPRGTTLLEAVVALSILLVGILGLMQLQVLGITSNAGASSYTQAAQYARELAAALEQLGPTDPLLAQNFSAAMGTPTTAAPAGFGSVLASTNTVATSGFTAWNDGTMALPGVSSDAQIRATQGFDPVDATLPRYQRRWQVLRMTGTAATSGINLIAVSVTYREPRLPGLREVVLLTQVSNKGQASSFASAFR